jgi:dTDP-4-dehydrorhamnose 3,5-epimerase
MAAFILNKEMVMQSSSRQSPAQASTRIAGVYTVPIRVFEDERGRFMESFRRDWFPWIDWKEQQGNQSDSAANVLRGLHYHLRQIDYWHVTRGRIRVGMVDLRRSSPTYMATEILEVSAESPTGVFIPVGVAHGFYALTDASLTYLVNQYYTGGDENGVLWNDPDINLDWGASNPIISGRDANNPRLRDIPHDKLPE